MKVNAVRTTVGYHAHSDGSGAGLGYLSLLQIELPTEGDLCRASISPHFIRCVSWLGDGKAVKSILFRLETGRAIAVQQTTDVQPAFDTALTAQDDASRVSANLTMYLGKYMVEKMLALPPPVAAHVTGGKIPGQAWAWGFKDQLELWSDATRAARAADAINQLVEPS